MKNTKMILIFFLMLTVGIGQQISSTNALRSDEFKIPDLNLEDELNPFDKELVPLESPIDSDLYLVGPGDIFGVNIVTSENLTFTATVGPAGDLLLPSVGIIALDGKYLTDALNLISAEIQNNYRNALVNVTLVMIRDVKIQVVGAVNSPGFVIAKPVDRLTDVIDLVDGLHKYADETAVQLKFFNKDDQTVSIQQFIRTGELEDNPQVGSVRRISVPYLPGMKEALLENSSGKQSAVFVTGEVQFPGAYRFVPGLTVEDYLGIAGGVLTSGSTVKFKVIRNGERISLKSNNIILSGDQVIIPENLTYKLFGSVSILATVRNLASLYLTYLAATR